MLLVLRRRLAAARDTWFYWCLIALCGASYWYIRDAVVEQEPCEIVTKSNITVMLIASFIAWGFANSFLWRRLQKRYPILLQRRLFWWSYGGWLSWVTWLIVMGLLVGLFSTVGYQTRW